MSDPKTRISLGSKILIPLLLCGLITTFFGAWVSYQTALGQLKNQLIERGRLLSITMNEVTELLVENDDIRLAVDVLVRKEIGVHGISVVTKEPFVIWASSLHPDTVNDQLVQEMLELLMTSTERGIFGHYFEDNGDYVTVWPLQMRGKNDIVRNSPFENANGSKLANRSLPMENRRQPIFTPDSIIRIPATNFRGAIYLRFDWATVKQVAANILWLSAIIMLGGIALMMLLTYIIIDYTVLQPMKAIGVTINKQECLCRQIKCR